MAEVMRNIQVIEINSEKINDSGLTILIKRCLQLRILDIAGCPNICGIGFEDAMKAPVGED